jgi:NAD+ synthase
VQRSIGRKIDPQAEADRIAAAIRHQVGVELNRRGLVVAVSGGIDSSVCAALAVKALGPQRVLALALPENESDPLSLELAEELTTALGIELRVENIGPMLRACGCYARREAAVQRVIPEFSIGWRFKLVIANQRLESDQLNVTYLEAVSPTGEWHKVRLPTREYREIVAATNFKQRIRKMMEYFHADRMHYAVTGTPNRLEYDQGFFVKGGDGLADVKPIAHLYKTEVYQLADVLGVPERIIARTPTTDTFSLPQTQEEFYFALPASVLEQLIEAHDQGLGAADVAHSIGFTEAQVQRAFRDIEQKRATTKYLHMQPLLVEEVDLSPRVLEAAV